MIILLETFKLELIPQQLKFHKVVTLARLHYEKYIQEGKVQEVQQDQEGPQEQTKATVEGQSGSKDKQDKKEKKLKKLNKNIAKIESMINEIKENVIDSKGFMNQIESMEKFN